MMSVCLSEIVMMRLLMTGVTVLVDVVVVLRAHFSSGAVGDCDLRVVGDIIAVQGCLLYATR